MPVNDRGTVHRDDGEHNVTVSMVRDLGVGGCSELMFPEVKVSTFATDIVEA